MNSFDRSAYAFLKQIVDALASVCDGAEQRDDNGFDGTDALAGHLLAFLPLAAWPLSAFHRAWLWRRKYHRQLEHIACPDVAEPPLFDGQDRQIAFQTDGRAFLVVFPYDGALLEAFRALPGARIRQVQIGTGRQKFTYRTVWTSEPGAVAALLAFAERHHFELAPEVAALLDRPSPSRIVFEANHSDTFAVYFPRNAAFNEEIKRIPGRRPSFADTFCWLVPATPLAAQNLLTFVHHHPHFQVEPAVMQRLQTLAGHCRQEDVV